MGFSTIYSDRNRAETLLVQPFNTPVLGKFDPTLIIELVAADTASDLIAGNG